MQAVWVSPDSVCFGPTIWDMLLVFLCCEELTPCVIAPRHVRAPGTRHDQVSQRDRFVSPSPGTVSPTAKKLSYLTNVTLKPSKVEEPAASYSN